MIPPIRFLFRSRFLLHSAAPAAALLLALASPALAAEVASLSGTVESGRGEPAVWQAASEGETLAPGDRVRTGADGRAELVVGRATIRLYPNSMLRIPDDTAVADDGDAVLLEEGTSLFDVIRGSRPFEVRTPEVVVSVKGTRFSVSVGGLAASVAVFRGLVGVKSLAMEAAREMLVREGFVASGHEELELRVLELDDPWDAFDAETLPRVPSPGPETASNRAVIDAARSAALENARPEAAARAAKRHASVRERVAELRAQAKDVAPDGTPGTDAPVAEGVLPGSASDRARGPRRDRAADAPAAIAESLAMHRIEAWLSGVNADAAGYGSAYTVNLVPESGQVLLEGPDGMSWTLDATYLEGVLEGTQVLPSDLMGELESRGIPEGDFAEQMLSLL